MEKAFYQHGLPYVDGVYIRERVKAKLTLGAWCLLDLLQSHKNPKTGLCNPSQQLLAMELNRSVRSIQRYIKELVEKGFIKVERQGKMITNKYFFYIDEKLQAFKESFKKAKDVAKQIKEQAIKVTDKITDKCNSYINYPKKKKSNDTWNYDNEWSTYNNIDSIEKKLLGLE